MLGLPLAFILSQDQTLRCIQKVKLLLRSLPISYIRKLTGVCFSLYFFTKYMSSKNFFLLLLFFVSGYPFLFSHRSLIFVFQFSGRKGSHLFLFSKTFSIFFQNLFCFVFSLRFSMYYFVFQGCKGNQVFLISKFYFLFF